MNRIHVETPDVRGDTLVGEVTATGRCSRFFSGKPFEATYSSSIERTPEHVCSIPILAHVCPVAWATGADVTVDTADARFLDALRRVRSTFLEMYPEFMAGSSIHCSNPVEAEREPGEFDGAGVLFTGGVDSTATYVRHRDEDPTLVSVRGWVIREDEGDRWDRTRNYVESFAGERGHESAFVESNMLTFLAEPLLLAHFQRYLDGAWYSSVGHGVGLLGLCAPMAHAEGWGSLYIAASHTSEWSRPWGSGPDIEDNLEWTGTDCSHDGYHLTRQEKIELIAEYVESAYPTLHLRTCTVDDGAGNCSDCEKCYRTTIGLLLAGLDPNDHGYEFDPGTFDEIRDEFERGDWFIPPTTRYHWNVLQEAAREGTLEHVSGGNQFLDWLVRQDFEAFVETTERPLHYRALQMVARNTPTPVYSMLYSMYRRVAI